MLCQLPLDERIRLGGDLGAPAVLSEEEFATPFMELASQVVHQLPATINAPSTQEST